MKSLVILILCICCTLAGTAQQLGCATRLSEDQQRRLKEFQASLGPGTVFHKKKDIRYIPLQIHIVGTSAGQGYYSFTELAESICKLNRDYEPVGFYFYLADTLHYINDDGLYHGQNESVYQVAAENRVEGRVNVFFHGTSDIWCGVYFPYPDVVLVVNKCAKGDNATTWTHELGHFFSLPHTFSGWENGNVPLKFYQEKMDESNCKTAGDGFCDTRPDYVSSRWECPYPGVLTDPNNIQFRPDSSLYMSYSMDQCQGRFSDEQIEAMHADLETRNISETIYDTASAPPPVLVYPLAQQKNLNPERVKLVWNRVPGAWGYYVQVAHFGAWQTPYITRLVYDTSTYVTLFGEWPFSWRVKTFSAGNFCSDFSEPVSFTTKPLAAGMEEVSVSEGALYPNPVKAGETIYLKDFGFASVMLYGIEGKLIVRFEQVRDRLLLPQLPSGLYTVLVLSGSQITRARLHIID